MAVTLIGYRGCGKSTVAPALAERLGWPWFDADVELERRAGRSIREIFARDGEPFFRDLEQAVLADLLARGDVVVAAGGGAVLREANRATMRRAGPVFWLSATADVLFERIHGDPTTAARRPSLTGLDPREEILQLLSKREPLYRETATAVIDAGRRSVADIVAEILATLGA